ncbi:DinB family protein [Flavilitoribacter nigricans]|uniref:Damage-inducible protein DinB n=1 Tax=Flavilitoribacter nigricans (strain ATCC 23147 / DSM 23189 / NBRC 102662 / NCIMB 1420 / SS-2) TaxID=1122177 RepID=A0A2D0NDU7_FLAN2|nr:DinB family protein [Flavilitoribacter nigricans]PHN06546.1 damage-inducible protein DinB [Flavilitoribacter nigricans DSM 23189 = NBRC 102662]
MRITPTFSTLFALMITANFALAQTDNSTLIVDWERAKAYTLEYMEAMPEESYSLQPTPEMRSFAQQMLHLTDGNYGFAANALGVESPSGFGDNEKVEDQSKANVIKLVTDGYDFIINAIKDSDPAKMGEKVTLFGRFEMSRKMALAKGFEHQTHHRGQTTVYLRLAGVTPPQEKLF